VCLRREGLERVLTTGVQVEQRCEQRTAHWVDLDRWERPGNIGHCFWTAVLEEGVDSTTLDQLLAPYWPVLWRLAARGHWIRHDHRPVRLAGPSDEGVRPPVSLPPAMTADDVTVSFAPAGGANFITTMKWGSRRFGLDISQYPELVEFRAMLEADGDRPWMPAVLDGRG
jgi:hypothetical protein